MEKNDKNIDYSNKLMVIIEKILKSGTPQNVNFNDVYSMICNIHLLILSDELNNDSNYKVRGDLCKKKLIPIINFLIKTDNDKEHNLKYYEILKYSYKIAARISLEHFFIYREWETKEKFYAKRRNILRGYIHYLEEIDLNPNFKLLIANMPSGYGKLLANDTPILTKNGWKKHGDLKVGDYVISPKGEFIKVNLVHPKRLANVKVTFEDGEEILCHNQHEWQVYDRHAKKEKHVETTYIMNNIYEKNGRNRFLLPLRDMVLGEEKKLPIVPYTYGVWLEILSGRINSMYLTSSINQRLELLAGLIDANGYLDKNKQRYIIVTCREKLKDDIVSLLYTFGWRTCVTKENTCKITSGIVVKHNTYNIRFSPTMKIPCKLKRKQLDRVHKQRRIGFSKIEFIKPVEGNCITVDGGLYLAGRTLKMTHNTYPEKISEAWSFGIDDKGAILSLCSNDTVVKAGSIVVKNEIKQPYFGEVFPNLKYDSKDKDFFLKETEGDWKLRNCTLGSSYNASTTNSNVVGQRASKRIHIDDLYPNHKEAENKKINQEHYDNFHTVWKKRFIQEAPTHKIVVTGTLWSSDDLMARLITWATKKKKFVKSKEYPFTFVSEDGTMAIIRVPALDYVTGESTCPEIRTTAQVIEDKLSIEEYLFQTNFQQIPTDPEAMFFSYTRLKTYSIIPQNCTKESYAVIDATRKSGKDFFAMPIHTKLENNDEPDYYYLKDCIFTREATSELYDKIVDKIIENHIVKLVIESNVAPELRANIEKILAKKKITFCEIFEKYNTIPKPTRIEAQKGKIKRYIFFPQKGMYGLNTEMGMFMDCLTSYNNEGMNANDDAPDSEALFYAEIVEEEKEEDNDIEVIPWIRSLI